MPLDESQEVEGGLPKRDGRPRRKTGCGGGSNSHCYGFNGNVPGSVNHVMNRPTVHAIYWDTYYINNPKAVTLMNLFFTAILGSTYMDGLQQYGVGANAGLAGYTIRDPTKDVPPNPLSQGHLEWHLSNWIAAGDVPPPDKNTLYFIFTPRGVVLDYAGGQSGTDFNGYHDAMNYEGLPLTTNVFYAVIPFEFNDADAWIRCLYLDLLGRNPENDQVVNDRVAALAGGASAQAIVDTFLRSQEYCTNVVSSELYQKLLDRPATPAELAPEGGSVGALMNGTSVQQKIGDFCSSPEYLAKNPLPDAFVDSLYRNLLGRASDAAGRAGWLARITQGATPVEVTLGFLRSQEWAMDQEASMFISYLNRAITPLPTDSWVADLTAPPVSSLQDVRNGILCSPEYRERSIERKLPDPDALARQHSVIASHEMVEGFTDPSVLGFTTLDGCEIGDICENRPNGTVRGWSVQPYWSNKDKKCIL